LSYLLDAAPRASRRLSRGSSLATASSDSTLRSLSASSGRCRLTKRADDRAPRFSGRSALRIGRLNADLLKEAEDGPQRESQTLLNESLDLLPDFTAIDLR